MIPDYEDFIKDVKSIWSDGNLQEAYRKIKYVIDQVVRDEDGFEPTYSFLMEKWRSHIQLWNYTFGSKDEKYLSGKDRASRLNLFDFLDREMYWNEYSLDKGEHKRDEYLFPQWLNVSELSDIFKKISDKIDLQRKNIINGTKKTTN